MASEKGVSKAARIRHLLDQGFTNSDIAETIGCLPEYVRAVRQRMAGEGGMSVADRNYQIKRYGSIKAFFTQRNEETRDYRLAYYRKRWREDPDYRASRNAQRRQARAEGLP